MVQSCSQARDNPDWDAQGGGCRDPFRNNITKIKTFIAAPMFIFLQYCKISRVSQLCGEAASDSYVINYNFLPPLLNCNWCDITPIKRNALQLHTAHTLSNTDLCKWKEWLIRSPATFSLYNQNFALAAADKKGTSCYFPRVGTKCVLLLIFYETAEKFYKPL